MNCFFCHQPCLLINFSPNTNEIWQCLNHRKNIRHHVHFTYHKSGDCQGPDCCPKKHFNRAVFDWLYKNKLYEITWFMSYSNERWSRQNSVRISLINDEYSGFMESLFIHEIPFHPKDLTPENIDQKIPLWLNFL